MILPCLDRNIKLTSLCKVNNLTRHWTWTLSSCCSSRNVNKSTVNVETELQKGFRENLSQLAGKWLRKQSTVFWLKRSLRKFNWVLSVHFFLVRLLVILSAKYARLKHIFRQNCVNKSSPHHTVLCLSISKRIRDGKVPRRSAWTALSNVCLPPCIPSGSNLSTAAMSVSFLLLLSCRKMSFYKAGKTSLAASEDKLEPSSRCSVRRWSSTARLRSCRTGCVHVAWWLQGDLLRDQFVISWDILLCERKSDSMCKAKNAVLSVRGLLWIP